MMVLSRHHPLPRKNNPLAVSVLRESEKGLPECDWLRMSKYPHWVISDSEDFTPDDEKEKNRIFAHQF